MLPDGHRRHYLWAARSHICSPPIVAVVWPAEGPGSVCVPGERQKGARSSPLPAATGDKSVTNPPPTRRQRRTAEIGQAAPFASGGSVFAGWFLGRRQMCSVVVRRAHPYTTPLGKLLPHAPDGRAPREPAYKCDQPPRHIVVRRTAADDKYQSKNSPINSTEW